MSAAPLFVAVMFALFGLLPGPVSWPFFVLAGLFLLLALLVHLHERGLDR